jgi:CarD family transcriptional regulator
MSLQFKVGGSVVHPAHGVGVVTEIKDMIISGRLNKYYIIEFPLNELDRVMIPIENAENLGLRAISDKKTMAECLDIIKDTETKYLAELEQESFHKRHKEYVDRVQSGDVCEVAKVFKALYERSRDRDLGLKEKFLLERAEKMIVGEVMYSKKVTLEKAQNILDGCKI